MLQLLSSEFPGGLPGASLLLLRTVLGSALLVQGAYYMGQPDPAFAMYSLSASALVCGSLLLIGFLTPFAGIVTGLGAIGVLLSLFPPCTPNVFDSRAALIFALTMLLTVIGVGPGRFSVDARMFGRREIVIPIPDLPLDL